jgi:hypothetical protein
MLRDWQFWALIFSGGIFLFSFMTTFFYKRAATARFNIFLFVCFLFIFFFFVFQDWLGSVSIPLASPAGVESELPGEINGGREIVCLGHMLAARHPAPVSVLPNSASSPQHRAPFAQRGETCCQCRDGPKQFRRGILPSTPGGRQPAKV